MTYALAVAALVAAWAWILRYHPPVHIGGVSITTTTLLAIRIRDGETYPAAVAAQEIYELRFMWATLIFGWLFFRRSMELRSHSLECAAASMLYGRDYLSYATEEARSMVGYPWLKDLRDVENGRFVGTRIVPELMKRRDWAEGWVKANYPVLKRLV